MDYEREELARELVDKHQYTAQQARIEAKGVEENRRQNVAVTVDKIKYFFRHALKGEDPRLAQQKKRYL